MREEGGNEVGLTVNKGMGGGSERKVEWITIVGKGENGGMNGVRELRRG